MEVLGSRVILAVADLERARHFYERVLGLEIYREYGAEGVVLGVVYFLGGGFLEVTGGAETAGESSAPGGSRISLWLQVRDVAAEEARLAAAGVKVTKPAGRMPWGLLECWVEDAEGVELRLVQVPSDHPIRRRVD